ncbi:MAG: lamin tail domain-containing protein [Cytophagales bacterium]|nr:lamin tail domain-containing protein [Cytophagales bacterium]MDW8383318.1 lamin tail domain-containing protein [Flammeovirgaceae bacterium]
MSIFKIVFIGSFVGFYCSSFAQILFQDNFNYTSFSSSLNSWTAVHSASSFTAPDSFFSVTGTKLQSRTISGTGNRNTSLSAPLSSSLALNSQLLQWTFNVEIQYTQPLSAALTATNHARVYLVASNNTDLNSANGYYVRVDTMVYLYATSSSTPLISSTRLADGLVNVGVRVTRQTNGTWELFVNNVSQGTVNNTAFTTSERIGFNIRYSSNARSGQFAFDSLVLRQIVPVDSTPPTLDNVTVNNARTLTLKFSEPVMLSTVIPANFVVNGSINPHTAVRNALDSSVVSLTFSSDLPDGSNTLSINNIRDTANNLAGTLTRSFTVVSGVLFSDNFNYASLSSSPNTWTAKDAQGLTTLSSLFTISNNDSLRSVSRSNALPSPTYISAPLGSTVNLNSAPIEWTFVHAIYFNPRTVTVSTNNSRFYLVSDIDDLNGTVNGYYLQIDTMVSLFKTGTTPTLLKSSSPLPNGNVNISVRVIRLTNGLWELFVNNVSQGTATDNQFTTSSYIGMQTRFSAGTRAGAFAFDNILMRNFVFVDTVAPSIADITQLNATTFNIRFTEPVRASSVQTSNFLLNGTTNPSTAIRNSPDSSLVTITFASAPSIGTNTLTVLNIADSVGNVRTSQTRTFEVSLPSPQFGDLIITEIFADVNPAPSGMPANEYFEIYNRSNHRITLRNCTITAGTKTATFPDSALNPGQYAIVAPTSTASSFSAFGYVIALSGWATNELNDTGEPLTLRNPSNVVLHELNYSDAWHENSTKRAGGWSLEMINFSSPCFFSLPSNWTSSQDTRGGTPGSQNSVFSNAPDLTPPSVVRTQTNDTKTTITVFFSEPIDVSTIVTGNFVLRNEANQVVPLASATASTDNPSAILTVSSPLAQQTHSLTISSIRDCPQNTMPTTTVSISIGVAPNVYDLIITEIMATPSPSVGLPEFEYIEILNRSGKIIDLSGMRIRIGSAVRNLTATTLQPNEYGIICSATGATQLSTFGKVIIATSMASDELNKTGENVELLAADGKIIHDVIYTDDWYGSTLKANGGYSLEMIDTARYCLEIGNWTGASNNSIGGTPGSRNSMSNIVQDTRAPFVQGVYAESESSAIVYFSEKMSLTAFTTLANYQIDKGISISSIVDTSYRAVRLNFTSPLVQDTIYTLSVSGVRDCAGNLLNVRPFRFGLGTEPNYHDVIITEIMADPTPQVGLPNAEFIEIYNRTNRIINLNGTKLNTGSDRTFGGVSLLPNEYMIVCAPAFTPLFENFGKVYGLPGMTSSSSGELTNSGEQLALFTPSGSLMFAVEYKSSWYNDTKKDDGGWSLEMIDTDFPCVESSNWSASVHPNGGTPGAPNSVRRANPDNTRPEIAEVIRLSSVMIEVAFTERLDTTGIRNPSNYLINRGKTVSQVIYLNQKRVRLRLSPEISLDSVYEIRAQNLRDCAGNLIISNTFQFGAGNIPQRHEVIITELFPSPSASSSTSLSATYEYLELYNRTNKPLSLDGVQLIIGSAIRTFEGVEIFPNEYLIVSAPAAVSTWQPYGRTIGLRNLSTSELNNTGELVRLVNQNGETIFSITYSDSWYRDNAKKSGWALEMIDTDFPCVESPNWTASVHPRGGTPGAPNSVRAFNSDNIPPIIADVAVTNDNEITVTFNEKMNFDNISESNFSVDRNVTVEQVLVNDDFSVSLLLSASIEISIPYTLSVSDVVDCSGNLNGSTQTRTFARGVQPKLYDIIITEIFPDYEPQVGLPKTEFLELYNRTNQYIDLENSQLTIGTKVATFPKVVLAPKEFVIVCANSRVADYQPFGRTIGMNISVDELNVSDELVMITNPQGELVFDITYSSDWYGNSAKSSGGWSLEMIDTASFCLEGDNWTASIDAKGGTPGRLNSVFRANPDTKRPNVVGASLVSNNAVEISFSEKLKPIGLDNKNNFLLSDNLAVSASQIVNSSRIRLDFSPTIQPNKLYTARAINLQDCAGNPLENNTTQFGKGIRPTFNQILITEIFANPNPASGTEMPNFEFIEIYNPTDLILELDSMFLIVGSAVRRFPASVILPKEYVIVTAPSAMSEFTRFGKVIGIPSLSTTEFNNSGEPVVLRNPNGSLIFEITYSDKWYRDDKKKGGGWSLEMIDIGTPCLEAENWIASADMSGGTPGRANSNKGTATDKRAPKLIRANAMDSITVQLVFDEKLDSISVASAQYAFDNSAPITSIRFRVPQTNVLTLTTNQPFETRKPYTISVAGLSDCSGNRIANNNPEKATFFIPEPGIRGDILLNEILFNPPAGGVDFVELYNNSLKHINLQNWALGRINTRGEIERKTITTDIYILPPGGYVAITPDVLQLQSQYPTASNYFKNFLEASLPTYPDNEGTVLLFGTTDTIPLQRFDYNEKMHLSFIDNVEGVSLERISFNAPTNNPNSWKSASANVGFGTPGYRNSQFLTEGKGYSKNCFTIDPVVFTPYFGDGVQDFTTIKYDCNTNNTLANATVYDSQGRPVRTLLKNELLSTNGFYIWDGTDDDGKKVRTGYYMIWVETFDNEGNTNQHKLKVVVGTRF